MTSRSKLERTQHQDRDRSGRYCSTSPCDVCGKPIGTNYFSDDESLDVGEDDLGFFLCERKRCMARREKMDLEDRRKLYAAVREAAKTARQACSTEENGK